MNYFNNKANLDTLEYIFKDNVNVEGIPKELIHKGKWCCYRSIRTKDGKFKKTPFCPISGLPANTRNKNTFSNFDEAYEDYCWELNGYDGLGILLTKGLCLIDIDECYVDGKLSPIAKRLISYFRSYAEVSVSGTGIHILIKVKESFEINKNRYYLKNPHNKVEVYLADTGRYSTVTGKKLDNAPGEIIDGTEKMERFLENFMIRDEEIKQEPKKIIDKNILSKVQAISDYNLLGKIRESKAGDKFISLYDVGLWEDKYNSQSEADMELAGILAFFCAGDYERIEKLMWKSNLDRDKWIQNKNYLKNTIKKAVTNCHNFYNPH